MAVLAFFSCQIYFTSVSITSSPWFSTKLTEFSVWNLVCGFAQTKGQLIAFRFLAGVGDSAPLSVSMPHPKNLPALACPTLFETDMLFRFVIFKVGGGVLGDMWRPEERGKAIAIYSLAPLLGPVIGPVCGGW